MPGPGRTAAKPRSCRKGASCPTSSGPVDISRLPGKHLVDAGYVDADQLVTSARDHGVDLIGPTPKDNQWQARTEGAFTVQDFAPDRDQQLATCPAGHPSQSWAADASRGGR